MATFGPGDNLDEFVIERLLGVGGFGAVYLAHHESITIPTTTGPRPWQVAIKELTAPTQINRFKAEAGILISLSEKISELTRIHGFRERHGKAFIIMEYVPGGTLQQAADERKTQLPEKTLVEIGATLANVMHRMHTFSPSVIHRDMKPENAKVHFQGASQSVKVLDLGVSAVIQPGQVAKKEVVGTFAFAGPHQLRGEAPAAFMDQHSLATTLFYCLMPLDWSSDDKIPPFPFESWGSSSERDAILRQYGKGFMDAIKHVHGHLPDYWDPQAEMEKMLAQSPYSDNLKSAVKKMMAYHPHEKYTNLEVAQKALRGGNTTGLSQAHTMSSPPSMSPPSGGPVKSKKMSGAFLPVRRTTTSKK